MPGRLKKIKTISAKQMGFRKMPNNAFFLPTLLKRPKHA